MSVKLKSFTCTALTNVRYKNQHRLKTLRAHVSPFLLGEFSHKKEKSEDVATVRGKKKKKTNQADKWHRKRVFERWEVNKRRNIIMKDTIL